MFCGLVVKSVGPGFMFFMYSTPITMAVIESPGMPNTSAGIHAPASALLLAEPDSTMPSTWPVPNFSGSLELLAHRIGHPGRDVGAGAGQGAHRGAQHAAAQDLHRVLLGQRPLAASSHCRPCSTTSSAGGLVSTT
jgi:hypothetical protein